MPIADVADLLLVWEKESLREGSEEFGIWDFQLAARVREREFEKGEWGIWDLGFSEEKGGLHLQWGSCGVVKERERGRVWQAERDRMNK